MSIRARLNRPGWVPSCKKKSRWQYGAGEQFEDDDAEAPVVDGMVIIVAAQHLRCLCVVMCLDMCSDMCVHNVCTQCVYTMCVDMYVGMCAHMSMDICVDMRVDTCRGHACGHVPLGCNSSLRDRLSTSTHRLVLKAYK